MISYFDTSIFPYVFVGSEPDDQIQPSILSKIRNPGVRFDRRCRGKVINSYLGKVERSS